MTRTWKEVNVFTGREIEEDAPANSAGAGNVAGIGVGPKGEPGVKPKKKKKKDLYDGRTKSYREHRAKLEAARLRRQEILTKKKSGFVEHVLKSMLEVELEEELSPEQIAAEEQKAMDQFNSDMAKEFPPAKFTARATTSPMGGGIAFQFAVIPAKEAKGVALLNAPAHSKYMMHLTDNKNNRIPMSKFSIAQIMGNTFPVKWRKITGKSPTDAVKKMVDWFKKNKDGFEGL